MDTFLTTLLVIACFIIVVAVLLQPSKGGGLTPLGGSSQSIFGSTGGTTFLFRLTMWSAAFIMVVSLYLSHRKIQMGKSSVIDTTLATPPPATEKSPLAPGASPAAGAFPATNGAANAPGVTNTGATNTGAGTIPLSSSPAGTTAGGPTPQPLTQKPAMPSSAALQGAPSKATAPKTIPAPAAPTH